MPVDHGTLRGIADHSDKVAEGILQMSKQLEKLDSKSSTEISSTVALWAQNVEGLQCSLEGQQGIAKGMRESARMKDDGEESGEQFRDRYRFLMERLKADVRALFAELPEYVDLPQDFQQKRTWKDMKHIDNM